MAASETHRAIDAVWRIESPRLIAGLTRIVRDVGLAEDLAQDALVAALEKWPHSGVPDNPGAWLMATARNRAIDRLRRRELLERKHAELERELEGRQERLAAELEASVDDDIGDDLLRLIFTACHPVLSTEARVALTLRLLGGLTTDEIARAFLAQEPTIAQRIVRAKRTLADANVPFEVPRGDELARRLASVLEVLYLIFNEGYTASSGPALLRADLTAEAIRLTRLLRRLLPGQCEAAGLLALMLLTDARRPARTGPAGELIPMAEQDRKLWNAGQITEGVALVTTALAHGPAGPYQLQAAIAAVHDEAPTADATDWPQIMALYEVLLRLSDNPVVRLNHAVAVAMVRGSRAGLELLAELDTDERMTGDHRVPAVRAHLLEMAGERDAARDGYLAAAALASNLPQQRYLYARAARLAGDR